VQDEKKDWEHAGGKLAELGAGALTEGELLSILVAPGTPGNPAEKIAENILTGIDQRVLREGSFRESRLIGRHGKARCPNH